MGHLAEQPDPLGLGLAELLPQEFDVVSEFGEFGRARCGERDGICLLYTSRCV